MKNFLMFLVMLPISLKAEELVKLVKIPTEGTMRLYTLDGKELEYIRCHPKLKAPLAKAIACMKLRHPDLLPMTYYGCYNPRLIAGTDKVSLHTYGLAIDLNADIGVPERMGVCFEEAGFTWGGRWQGKSHDPMHFQVD